MDVNNTRFHLLLGQNDWLPAPQTDLEWNAADQTLILARKIFVFPPRRGEQPPDPSQRRGAARDRFGNWYWISDDRTELRFQGTATTASEHFWSAADELRRCAPRPASAIFQECPVPIVPPGITMAGLAITTEHYLAVGTIEPAGLLIFDLYGGGSPRAVFWPHDVAFRPFDMSPTPDGGAWILDRENRRYWKLDWRFQLVEPVPVAAPPQRPELFQPVAGPTVYIPQSLNAPITDQTAMPLTAADPVSIEGLPDGTVLVLDRNPGFAFSAIDRCRFGEATAHRLTLEHALAGYVDGADTIAGYDLAFVADASSTATAVSGTIYVVEAAGNQSFAFTFTASGATLRFAINPIYLPMRLFGGKALVSVGSLAYYDFGERWIALAEQPRPRFAPQATIQLPAKDTFDGREPGCVWHRLFLDACIPPGASVTVESRAADDPAFLETTAWQAEPSPYLREDGIELAYCPQPLTGPVDRTGTWELLFQNAVGRYLQLRVTLAGTGRNTPKLRALRAYYPRFSYVKEYLPAAYREEPASASFLDRYLANTEGFFTDLEGKIAAVQKLFDTRTIPAEYLDWLAEWFGATLDMGWDESRRRLFLANAPQIFRERGTLSGLIRTIRLSLDACPDQSLFSNPVNNSFTGRFSVRIVENYLLRSAPGVDYGDASAVQGPGAVVQSSTWTPALGATPLHRQYRAFLSTAYSNIAALNTAWGTSFSGFDNILLPAVEPAGTQGSDWNRFVTTAIGFAYAPVTASDAELYRQFLARRYPQPADLNRAYLLSGATALANFNEVLTKLWQGQLVNSIPASGRFLQDWILFVSVVVPAARNAHRFTVLVPVTVQDSLDTQQSKREVARRVADAEKPAHTSFDVKLYFALFRVGAARLGMDTVLGESGRFVALLLGQTNLAAGFLGFTEPWNVEGRRVVGRDAVGGRVNEMTVAR